MARHGTFGRDGAHPPQLVEPADDASVDGRDAVDEKEIGEPEGSRVLVEHRQIVVGVSGPLRPDREAPIAQIEFETVGDEDRRRHNLAAVSLLAENAAQVVFPTLREGAGEFGMADEIGVIIAKGRGAEDMVGMDMRQDHIADPPVGSPADRRAQRRSFFEAATRIDDGDGIAADDKADVRDRVTVRRIGLLMCPAVNEDTGRDSVSGNGEVSAWLADAMSATAAVIAASARTLLRDNRSRAIRGAIPRYIPGRVRHAASGYLGGGA